MKKLFMLLTAVCAMLQVAMAADKAEALLIQTKDGQTVSYSLTARPVVTFEATDLVLTTTEVSVKYPLADVKDITFGSNSSAIDVMNADIAFTINGDQIVAQGLGKGDRLQVYGIDGKVIANAGIDAEGTAKADISSLGHGIYVVKAGKKSYRIMK